MKLDSVKNKKMNLLKAVMVAGVVLGSGNAFADKDEHEGNVAKYMSNCEMLPLVTTLIGGPVNTTVCVDAPVALEKAKVVFNLDAAVRDGLGRPTGLRHMWMMGTALKARIDAGLVDPKDVSIIGVTHGSGINMVLGNNTASDRDFIEKIYALEQQGVNISLEICGVTMAGKGLTRANLYSSDNGMIHVNQGAIGRIIDLEQHRYAYIQEE